MLKEILDKFYNLIGEPIETDDQFSELNKLDLTFEETQVRQILKTKILLKKRKYKEAQRTILEVKKSIENKDLGTVEAFVFKYLSFISSVEGKYSENLMYALKFTENSNTFK